MGFTKQYSWYKIAEVLSDLRFPPSGMIQLQINNKDFCITLFKGQLFSCTATCPHAGGKLHEGYLDALGNIVCPLHHYKFNPWNGRNVTGEGYFLKTFPVEIRKEGIFIGFEENPVLNG